METLRLGSTGPKVQELQKKLNLIPDGKFGPITEEAVKAFQKSKGLTADGIVGSATWNALNAGQRKINEIILHCSATPEGKDYTVANIKQWHLARGFSDVGYHYIIYRDGSIHEGRKVSSIGAHCTGHNSNSIGICYIGGCDIYGKKGKDTRTPQQKESLVKLVKELMLRYGLSKYNVHCHNEYAAKECPSFKIEQFRNEI